MIRQIDMDLAAAMLAAQSQDFGTIPDSPETASLYEDWEAKGWVESHIDSDGDLVYLLTFAGRDAILGAPKVADAN